LFLFSREVLLSISGRAEQRSSPELTIPAIAVLVGGKGGVLRLHRARTRPWESSARPEVARGCLATVTGGSSPPEQAAMALRRPEETAER